MSLSDYKILKKDLIEILNYHDISYKSRASKYDLFDRVQRKLGLAVLSGYIDPDVEEEPFVPEESDNTDVVW